jgi:hypothetical protein
MVALPLLTVYADSLGTLGGHDPGQSGAGYVAYVVQGCANISQRHKSLRNKEAGKSHFPGSWLKKSWTDFFNILLVGPCDYGLE